MDQATLMAAAASAICVLIGWILFGEGESAAQKRTKALMDKNEGRPPKKSFMDMFKPEDTSARRKQIEESLSEIENRQKDKAKQQKTLKAKLHQADWSTTPQTFTIISVVIGVIVGLVVMIVAKNPMFAAGAAFATGFGLPRWFLNMIIGRRQKKFVANFADAMDIIVRGVRTGLPLGDCLKIIAHESPEPVAGEFRRVVEGEAVGVPLERCLERMYERMPVPEVNFFATVLSIQRTTGGNLGEALGNLSGVLRGRKLLREKIKSLSAEAKMSAIIIGALPVVVMTLVTIASPDYMDGLYNTDTGQRNMMIGAAMMVLGTAVMKKMINFKI